MAILTPTIFQQRTYKYEKPFTADTNMYISHNYPFLRGYYYHIPNESQDDQHHVKGRFTQGDRHRIELAALGVMPGVPDFRFEPVLGHTVGSSFQRTEPIIPGWYLELKIQGRVLSESQRNLHKRWSASKIIIHTAWTPSEVCLVLSGIYGQPLYT